MLGASALARAGRALAQRGGGSVAAPLRSGHAPPLHSSAGSFGGAAGGTSGGGAAAGGLSFVPAFPIGVFSGGVGSFVGIGGALLMVPLTGRFYQLRQLQVWVLRTAPLRAGPLRTAALLVAPLTDRWRLFAQANATALAPNVATCLSGVACFGAVHSVDWTAAALVALSAAATTRVGARLAHKLTERSQKLLFGAAMCALGPAIAAKPLLQRAPEGDAEPVDAQARAARVALHVPPLREAAYFVTLGSVTGLCSGVMGIGAGVMCTVGLAVGGPAWWGHHLVLGTAFASQLLPHATGAFTHWQLGNLRLDLVPALVLGSACGSALASKVAVDVDEGMLRNMFAAYALLLGGSYLRIGAAMPRVLKGAS